jgi:L-cystine transport system permease protein
MIAFPNIGNSIIGFLKDSSLAFTIGVMDIVGRGNTLIASSVHALEVYIALSIIYYAVVIILEKGFSISEKRLQRHESKLVTQLAAVEKGGTTCKLIYHLFLLHLLKF